MRSLFLMFTIPLFSSKVTLLATETAHFGQNVQPIFVAKCLAVLKGCCFRASKWPLPFLVWHFPKTIFMVKKLDIFAFLPPRHVHTPNSIWHSIEHIFTPWRVGLLHWDVSNCKVKRHLHFVTPHPFTLFRKQRLSSISPPSISHVWCVRSQAVPSSTTSTRCSWWKPLSCYARRRWASLR